MVVAAALKLPDRVGLRTTFLTMAAEIYVLLLPLLSPPLVSRTSCLGRLRRLDSAC